MKREAAAATEREAAAWYLARWHYVAKDYAQALENIEFCKLIRKAIRKRTRVAEAQCLIQLQRFTEADEVLAQAAEEHAALDFPLLQSTVTRYLKQENGHSTLEAEAAQLSAINAVLGKGGLAPIRKERTSEPLTLANLASDAAPLTPEQAETVSVIVPAFNCASTITWVLKSILAQTWENLEVVVVDDASTDSTSDVVESFCSSDARVRLIRNERNVGAYATRNVGARAATGALLMVHDSDDWSHPQRIELQVHALRKNPATIAVISHWVRVGMQLQILGAWITRGSVIDLNFSSLLFRRELLNEIGYWDEVAVAGDAEFHSRVRSLYGEKSVARLPESQILSFSLTRDDSLTQSRATHLKTMFHGLRWNYRDAYLFWHQKLRTESRAPGVRFDSEKERPFPMPKGMRVREQNAPCYDLVLVSDFSQGTEHARTVLDYVVAAGKYCQRFAVLNWPQYEHFKRAPLNPRLYEACSQFGIDILSPGDVVHADTLFFASPSVLQYVLRPIPEIRADHVLLLAGGVDAARRCTSELGFDPAIVQSTLRALSPVVPIWVPSSSLVARTLQESDVRSDILNFWLPLLDTANWEAPPVWRGDSRAFPRLGRHVSNGLDWPSDPAALSKIYGIGAAREICVMGEAPPNVPPNWHFVPFRETAIRDFLRELDFFIYFPNEQRLAGSERPVIEAMAAGIPVILPPEFQDTFADAAAYAASGRVDEVVSALWDSRESYISQAERGKHFVREKCDLSILSSRLRNVKKQLTQGARQSHEEAHALA